MSLSNSHTTHRHITPHLLNSHSERPIISRLSLRNPQRNEQTAAATALRQRTMSASEEASGDTITELVSPPPMTTLPKPLPTPVDRRNSSPQINIGSFFTQAFQKKSSTSTMKTKDELIQSSNSTHQLDRMNSSNSKISVMANQNSSFQSRILSSTDKLTNGDLSQFTLEPCSMKPQSADAIHYRSSINVCISKIYRDIFYDAFHINYYGESGSAGPFLASALYINNNRNHGDSYTVHLIIRTTEKNHYLAQPLDEFDEEHILQSLFQQANVTSITDYGPVGDPRANEKLYQFDKISEERQNCKIGVMFQRRDQKDESDILSNEDLSDEMIKFFEIIAQRIELRGFEKYRADLDTTDDLHGDYSYYTEFNSHEIMFNIAPIIPSNPINGQYIERKSLVGNAFVCIVFQEAEAVFNPNVVSGRVTQIYITVQPIIIDRELYYKIGVWHRNEMTNSIDPPGGIFRDDSAFRRYFLTLLLNCVQAAIESPQLRGRVFEARRNSKNEDLRKLIFQFTRSPLPDFNQDIDISSFSNSSRPESVAGSTNSETRTSPVSAKKGGIQKRIKKIFSTRSASVSSPSPSESNNSQPSIMFETKTKESVKRTKSMTKPVSTPLVLSRPIPITTFPPQVSIQPATPGTSFHSSTTQNSTPENDDDDDDDDNSTINSAALFFNTRHRSNSSPDDTTYINTLFSAGVNDQVDSRSSSVSDDDQDLSDDNEEIRTAVLHRLVVSTDEHL